MPTILELETALTQMATNIVRWDSIINGPASGAGSTVETGGGTVPTVARKLSELAALIPDLFEDYPNLLNLGLGTDTPPILADFHNPPAGGVRFRFDGTTLNKPTSGARGVAIFLPRQMVGGYIRGGWMAIDAGGDVGNNEPEIWFKATSSAGTTDSNWGEWGFSYHSRNQFTLGKTLAEARIALSDGTFAWLEDFGMEGDGVAYDDVGWAAAIASGKALRGFPGARYRLHNANTDDAPRLVARGLDFDGQGCTFIQDGMGSILWIMGEWILPRNISEIDRNVLDPQTTWEDITVVGSTTPYVRGSIIKIGETETRSPQAAEIGRKGEWAVVQGVYAGKIRVAGGLAYQYDMTKVPRVALLNPNFNIHLRNFNVETPLGKGPTWDAYPLFRVDGAVGAIFENIQVNHIYDRVIRFADSVACVVDNLRVMSGSDMEYLPDEYSQAIRAYAVSSSNGYGMKVVNSHFQAHRHAITFTSTPSGAFPWSNMAGYGEDQDGSIENCTALNMFGVPFQTHSGARGTRIRGCRTKNSQGGGYTLRGVDVQAIDCVSENDRFGCHFYQQYPSPASYNQGCAWIGGTIINPKEAAFQGYGGVQDCLIKGATIELRGGATHGIGGSGRRVSHMTALFKMRDIDRIEISDMTVRIDNITFSSLIAMFHNADTNTLLQIDGFDITIGSNVVVPMVGEFANVDFYRNDYTSGAPTLRFFNMQMFNAGSEVFGHFVHGPLGTNSRMANVKVNGCQAFSNVKTIRELQDDNMFDGAVRYAGLSIMPKPLASISEAPTFLGQEALVGGQWYKAIGTSGTGHWKQITN